MDEELDVDQLKRRLLQVYNDFTKAVTLSHLQERGRELPLELVFAQVVTCNDQKYTEEQGNSDSRSDSGSETGCDSDYDGLKLLQDTPKELPDDDQGKDRYTEYTETDFEGFIHRTGLVPEKLSKDRRELVHPYDIFTIDNEVSSKIFMLGDAAHGKTTYCIWMVKKWCNAQNKESLGRILDVWERALKRFDFVFLLKFRNVNSNRACVVDMICDDVSRSLKGCQVAIRHVLSSEKYKSLVIMDGLDEWNPNDETVKQLTCQAMPNLEHLSSMVTSFISMRPWVFPAVSQMVQMNDRVIEILGLSKTGIENIIANVLFNRFKSKESSLKYHEVYNRIRRNLKEKSLKSFIQIPLLAAICVHIWYEGKQVGDSMTSFYAVMLDMLIARANEKETLQIESTKGSNRDVPDILSEHENNRNCISVLLKLGKVAYEGLLSNETNLVFQTKKLEKEIGVKELQFALYVGLISQKEVPSLLTNNVSVHFFHKSVQEFLAAIYIVTNREKVSDSFCKHLSTIKVIMELSNVIMFICGMCPCMGSVLSQCVVNVTDNDTEIWKYRSSPRYDQRSVRELYKIQVKWFREFVHGQMVTPLTDRQVTFHISDVWLSSNSDIETIKETRELLSSHHIHIRSLCLFNVPTDSESGITNTELRDFLCNKYNNTRSLMMIFIEGDETDRSVPPVCIPSLRCLRLSNVKINTTPPYNNSPPLHPLLTHMASLCVLMMYDVILDYRDLHLSDITTLRELWLERMTLNYKGLDLSDMTSIQELHMSYVTLGDKGLDLSNMTSLRVLVLHKVSLRKNGLNLSAGMIHIAEVKLKSVFMSAAQWEQFLLSLLNIKHRYNVELNDTNIGDESMKRIRSSSDFDVTQDGMGEHILGIYEYKLHFTRQRRGSPTTPGCSTHNKTPKHPMQKHKADKHRKRRIRDKERQRTTQKHQTQRTTHKPSRPVGNRVTDDDDNEIEILYTRVEKKVHITNLQWNVERLLLTSHGSVDVFDQNNKIRQKNPKFADYLSSIYPSELEVKETTETNNSASYLDIMLSYDTDGHMNTSLYDKRDDFNFSITNFPFLSSNIPSSPAYGVFISQLIRYARASTKYTDFVLRARRLSDKLLSQGYVCDRLTSSLRKFYGRYGELVIHYDVPLSRMVDDILS